MVYLKFRNSLDLISGGWNSIYETIMFTCLQTQLILIFRWADKDDLDVLNAFFGARNRGSKISWDHQAASGEPIFNPDEGFFIEADLEIPENKLFMMENFPPAPHKVVTDDLSMFSKELLESAGEQYHPSEKLCVTMVKKPGYITHYKLLDLYSEIGVKVTNIKRALKFTQEDFLRDWVEVLL